MEKVSKRCLKTLSLSNKLKIINEIDTGKCKKMDVAKKYDIPSSTLSTIYKNRAKILQYAEAGTDSSRKRVKPGKHPELEEEIMKWINSVPDQSGYLTAAMIRKRAQWLADQNGYSNFQASAGWYEKFKMRQKLKTVNKKIVKPVDVGIVAPGTSGYAGNDEFILPDSLPLSEPREGPKKPLPSENRNDNAQCSSSEQITIKTEPVFLDECDWELTTNSPVESSEASASKSNFPILSPPSNGVHDTTDHTRQSHVAQTENQQSDGLSASGSLNLLAETSKSNPTQSPNFSSSAETSISDNVLLPKITSVMVLSGNQSILNHQILRPEFFSASETGRTEGEMSISVHPPKKRRICPKSESNSPSPTGDLQMQSGQSTNQLECFGNYVVSKLRLMDPRTCLLVQKAISDIIFEAEMGKLILETRSTIPKSNFSAISSGPM